MPSAVGTGKSRMHDLLIELLNQAVDDIDDSKIEIDLAHHKIHEGDSYHVGVATNSAATLSISFKTGAKKLHILASYSCESKSHFQYKEGTTITATSGTEVIVYNRDRSSSNAPTILQNKSGAYVADSKVLQDATVAGGTTFVHHQNWGDKKTGGKRRAFAEWILDPDTVYTFLLTSDDGSKGLHIMLDWYEVTA